MWWLIDETRTVDRQLVPPSIERNERIWLEVDSNGTSTVPFGRTTGWPPSPCAPSPVARAGPQVRPPSDEVFIRSASLELVMSYSV